MTNSRRRDKLKDLIAQCKPAHPGETLREDVLPHLGMSRKAFARHLGIPYGALQSVLKEQKPMTHWLAVLLGKALGNGPRFWLTLQFEHDVWCAEHAGYVSVKPLDWKGPA